MSIYLCFKLAKPVKILAHAALCMHANSSKATCALAKSGNNPGVEK